MSIKVNAHTEAMEAKLREGTSKSQQAPTDQPPKVDPFKESERLARAGHEFAKGQGGQKAVEQMRADNQVDETQKTIKAHELQRHLEPMVKA